MFITHSVSGSRFNDDRTNASYDITAYDSHVSITWCEQVPDTTNEESGLKISVWQTLSVRTDNPVEFMRELAQVGDLLLMAAKGVQDAS